MILPPFLSLSLSIIPQSPTKGEKKIINSDKFAQSSNFPKFHLLFLFFLSLVLYEMKYFILFLFLLFFTKFLILAFLH